jgi:hypothetical protein
MDTAIRRASALSTNPKSDPATEREIWLEVARRANWDALHGPPHLRSGRFRPEAPADKAAAGGAKEKVEAPNPPRARP